MSCKINIGSAVASGENSKAIIITSGADFEDLKKKLEDEASDLPANVNAFSASASGKNSSATVFTVIPSSRLAAKKTVYNETTSNNSLPKEEKETKNNNSGETRAKKGKVTTINKNSAVADKPDQFVCVVPDEPIHPSAQALMDSMKKTWTENKPSN